MNPDDCKFVLDINPNFAYVSLGGVLYKVFHDENVEFDRKILEAADLVIKSSGVVLKCRFERNNPYIYDCAKRIRSLESFPELHLGKAIFTADFVNEKKKTLSEIHKFLTMTRKL